MIQKYVLAFDEDTHSLRMFALPCDFASENLEFEDGEGVYIIEFEDSDGGIAFHDATVMTMDGEECSSEVIFVYNQE